MNKVTGVIGHFVFLEIYKLLPSSFLKEDDLKVIVPMLLGEIVFISMRNVPNEKRRVATVQVM